ncbi:hypothetical protein DdX_12982 [Ditylenchus destructor]|uniref:Uncharacterized protein n=1 Tax=Ditylenchus destructor TaxID=166010 RepID=A0AAD4MW52_9BILA|nr:hypothetical protein DdX_12982 [Ditylenchus destructor]
MKVLAALFLIALFTLPADAELSYAQCAAACKAGVRAMESFCRLIPQPAVRSACWSASTMLRTGKGLQPCINFCLASFKFGK